MDTSLRVQYLQRLGVAIYVPRVEEKIEHKGHWEGPESANLVFLFQSIASELDWSMPVFQLLQKIIEAARTPHCSIALCFSPVLPFEIPFSLKNRRIVAFGKSLADLVGLHKPIQTISLEDLQYNETAKRALWQALKEVKAYYG